MEMNINNSFLIFVRRGMTNLVTQYEKGWISRRKCHRIQKWIGAVTKTDDELEYCIDRVASAVTNECHALKTKRSLYHIDTDKELVRESVRGHYCFAQRVQIRQRVHGNDVDREHYNRDSVSTTNIPPSSPRRPYVTEQHIDLWFVQILCSCPCRAELWQSRVWRVSSKHCEALHL